MILISTIHFPVVETIDSAAKTELMLHFCAFKGDTHKPFLLHWHPLKLKMEIIPSILFPVYILYIYALGES